MKLPSTFRQSDFGFTLIEIILVMALLVMVTGIGLFYGMENYQRSQFRSERDNLVSVFAQARAKAMANINQKPHGVHLNVHNYILFEGSIYDPGSSLNISYPLNSGISMTGMTEVLFSQLNGNAAVTGGSLTFGKGIIESVININNVGQITWTN